MTLNDLNLLIEILALHGCKVESMTLYEALDAFEKGER